MRNRISIAAFAFALAFVLPSCHSKSGAENGTGAENAGSRSLKPSGNGGGTESASGSDPIRPDTSKTPGDTLDVTKADICVPGYSSKVRNVPQSVKEQAYSDYGITHRNPGQYEIDHLISLELGGSNSIRNLWPQSYLTKPWNAHVKDALENRLHQEVCSGQTDLQQAQREISGDWIAAYKKRFPNPPGSSGSSGGNRTFSAGGSGGAAAQSGDRNEKVWVNLNSGKYWRPGTEFYGKTKSGKLMTEAEATQAGYVAAKGQ